MKKKRVAVPLKVREQVMKEFNHRCAIGGENNPQLHHIDGDPSNNDPMNLIPLCPNCHLSDQHNPTRSIEPEKLVLLRQYKDPTILKPQFHPLFARMQFLDSDIDSNPNWREMEEQANDLVDLVAELEMGNYYAKKIGELIKRPKIGWVATGDSEREERKHRKIYFQQLIEARTQVQMLVIEMLRSQNWYQGE
ncbi:MAG: HNH endonuclease [Anaerolineales bacterium]|nr:HNH endonuclease [Anaerolineales bacterium]